MSRHRHIRRMVADAYDELDDYGDLRDENYDEPEELPEDVQQYLWKGQSPASQGVCTGKSKNKAEEEALLSSLVRQVREVLQNDSLSREQIDCALVAANYNPEAAICSLLEAMEKKEEGTDISTKFSKLELNTPSQIGRMYDTNETEDPMRSESVLFSSPYALENTAGANGSFKFDVPSPDDVVEARKQRGKDRSAKLRLPSPPKRTPIKKPLRVAHQETTTMPSTSKEGTKKSSVQQNTLNMMSSLRISETSSNRDVNEDASSNLRMNIKQRMKPLDLPRSAEASSNSTTVVVVGHVDAGKSTFLGHLLQKTSSTMDTRKSLGSLAWTTDEDVLERERGITIDISTKSLVLPRSGRTLVMIDAPGHRDFVPTMILGAAQASAAILVIDSSVGEFEAGFSERGQTREHTVVLRSLGISTLIVVVNKMDTTNFSQSRFEEIKASMDSFLQTTGFLTKKRVTFIPCSAISGINLAKAADKDHPLSKWYKGKSVLESLEDIPNNASVIPRSSSEKATRFVVSDTFRSKTVSGSITITGRIICGSIAVRDNLLVLPNNEIGRVKAVEIEGERRGFVIAGRDNVPIFISLQDVAETLHVDPGSVLCDPENPVPVVEVFQAQIVTLNVEKPIIQGTKIVLHLGGGSQAATITKLMTFIHKEKRTTGRRKKRPRRLAKGDSAVVEIKILRPMCMELYSDIRFLGRFTLRRGTQTIAAGVVTKLVRCRSLHLDNSLD